MLTFWIIAFVIAAVFTVYFMFFSGGRTGGEKMGGPLVAFYLGFPASLITGLGLLITLVI